MTGGRLKRIQSYIGTETFLLTYGDGVADININSLISFHKQHGKHATLTAVQPPGRYGALKIKSESEIRSFREKPEGDGGFVNGGFFILEPHVFSYIDGDETVWEKYPLEALAAENQLRAFKHKGFWQPMDTLRDKNQLEELWSSGNAPWKIW
jgi:glucose-1-phosphate cytidylyltransferase